MREFLVIGEKISPSRHSQLLTYFVEQLAARAVLEEDELPVAGLVGPRSVASHNIVVPVSK